MFNVVIVSDSDVENNLVLQIGLGTIVSQSKLTIGAKLRMKTIEIDEKSVMIQIWDTIREENITKSTSIITGE